MSSDDAQSFVPSPAFSTNERDWQAEIGILPWTTSIVFTKETLIRFLKQLEVEVDTNMSQLKKLPKYAKFGTFTNETTHQPPPLSVPSSQPASDSRSAPQSDVPVFIPTRKVREQPGGGSAQIASLFGASANDTSAAWEPPAIVASRFDSQTTDFEKTEARSIATSGTSSDLNITNSIKQDHIADRPRVVMPDGSAFVPTRKVREPTGGYSSMGSILSGN